MTVTSRLWAAVDSITKPTTVKVIRVDAETDVAAELLHDLATNPRRTSCSILEKQRAETLATHQHTKHGRIPPLWEQACWAVFAHEAGDGTGGRAPLRERTPADLDLMETLLTIRESLGSQLPRRGSPWRKPGDIPDMMRQFASHLIAHEPQHVDWWAYRFEQWARLLRAHLNALDTGPKDRYIRDTPCPLCAARQATIESDGERCVVPTLVIDFIDGLVRAAQCQTCGHTWFRGDQLTELANLVNPLPAENVG